MNKSSFWIVILVASTWIGFLMGYSMSAHTGGGAKKGAADAAEHAPVSAGAGGYGAAPAASGGYGAAPAAGAGGYGR